MLAIAFGHFNKFRKSSFIGFYSICLMGNLNFPFIVIHEVKLSFVYFLQFNKSIYLLDSVYHIIPLMKTYH